MCVVSWLFGSVNVLGQLAFACQVVQQERVAFGHIDDRILADVANLHFVEYVDQVLVTGVVRGLDHHDRRGFLVLAQFFDFFVVLLFGQLVFCLILFQLVHLGDHLAVAVEQQFTQPVRLV